MQTQKNIFAIGNALVDHEYEVSDALLAELGYAKGAGALISEEDLTNLKNILAQKANFVKKTGGGSAANTAFAIAALGGKSSYACRVANDDAGKFYLADLNNAGVSTSAVSLADTDKPTGCCHVLITPDAERTMPTYLGATENLCEKDVDTQFLADSAYVFIEGYLASSETAVKAVQNLRSQAKTLGVKTALSFSDPSMVNFCKAGLVSMVGSGVDVLFCNQEEAMTFTGEASAAGAAKALHELASLVVITLGSEGVLISQKLADGSISPALTIPALKIEQVKDTNGAGDNFAGAFMYALTTGNSLEDCAKLAVKVAGALIQNFGPRLEAKKYMALKKEVGLV